MSTLSSGVIQVGGTGFAMGDFSGITQIDFNFGAKSQEVVFDSTNTSFNAPVSITSSGIASSDTVEKNGPNAVTFTVANTYASTTTINGGVLIAKNGGALGNSAVLLESGAEFRASGTLIVPNQIDFATTGSATVSTSGTLTLSDIAFGNAGNEIFGSAGNTGTVVINALTSSQTNGSATIEVAYGTLKNGGGLNTFTSTSATTVDAGATLNVNDQSMSILALAGTGNVTLGTKATTSLFLNAGNFGGVISGAGQVAPGGMEVVLTGSNTYTGGTILNNGDVLQLGNGGATGSIVGNVTNNGGDLIFDRSGNSAFSGKITGTGLVTQSGGGVLTLSGQNSYAGGTSITDGVINTSNANALGTGAVTLSAGTELRASGTFTLTNQVTFPAGQSATLSTNGTLIIHGLTIPAHTNAIFGSPGNAGTIVPSDDMAIDPTASVTVADGTLRNGLGGWMDVITSGAATTTVNTGATLDLNDESLTINGLLGTGSVKLGASASTVLTLNATSFGGVISGAGQVLLSGNSGILTLTGANTYTGGTTISTGSSIFLGTGGTTGSIVGKIIDNGQLYVDRSNAVTFSGVISGSGNVLVGGGGTVTLSGSNTYSGGTTVGSGVVSITNPGALGTASVTLSAGTELRTSGTINLTDAVNFPASQSATLSTSGTLTLNGMLLPANSTANFGSPGNAGTIVVSSDMSIDPAARVVVAYGTLRNGPGNWLDEITGTVFSTTVNPGATLDLNDQSLEVFDLAGGGSVKLGVNPATVLTIRGGGILFGGVISGAGGMVIATNTGSLFLTNNSTYTGGTTINSGTILNLGSYTTNGSIVGNITDNGQLQFLRTSAVTFPGVISGSGSVGQYGTASLTLSGNNTYTGGTTVAEGVLIVTNSNAVGTQGVTMGSFLLGLNPELRGSGTVTIAGGVSFAPGDTSTVSSTGTLTLGPVQISGTNTNAVFGSAGQTGTIVIAAPSLPTTVSSSSTVVVAYGTLRNGGGLNLLTSQSTSTTVDAGATLSVNDQSMEVKNLLGAGSVTLGTKAATVLTLDTATFSGVISGAGRVEADGEVVLTGANTYTGGTTLFLGTEIEIGSGGTTGSLSGNVVDNGTLVFNRSNASTYSGAITGSGMLTKNGSGALTLSGNNSSFTGVTTVNGGVLIVTNSNAAGTQSVTLEPGAELRTTGTISLPIVLRFAGNNAVVSSNGTLDLFDIFLTSSGINAVFGSPGNAGVIEIEPGIESYDAADTFEVAYGTLRNGAPASTGALGVLTAGLASTKVDAGATLSINDQSMEVKNLLGAGALTLGSKATTVLTLDAATFSGVISGAGQVTATGQVVLMGTNTYTGGTTINTGAEVDVGSGGTTGSLSGNVVDNGTLVFNRSNSLTYSRAISGPGTLIKNGSGALTLSGNNSSFTGVTTVNSGVLIVSNATALGTDNAAVALEAGAELRTTGTITLPNLLQFDGNNAVLSTNGTLTDAMVSLNAAGINAVFGSPGNAGIIEIDPTFYHSDDTIEVAYGTLRNRSSSPALGDLTVGVAATKVDAGAAISVNDQSMEIQNLLGAGAVTLGTKSTTALTLDAGNFSGVISGPGHLVKSTAGILTLAGANTYSGGTTVTAGALVAGNTTGSATGTGPVAIDTGATIGGSGTVSGAMTLNSGGTLKPGVGSPGVPGAKFHGSSLLWEGGGTLDFQIGPSTADELLLTGALTKGTAGTFTIDIENDGLATGNYILAAFSSTTFSLSDFTLDLPNSVSGILVENSKSLLLDITQAELPAHTEEIPTTTDSGLATASITDPSSAISFTPSEPLQPTPEPGSALLLAFGGATLLGWRRRR
ncbi:MAG TPA: autotransporter-associated beta strand repeat-containing protein [Chthoniobacter sp.]